MWYDATVAATSIATTFPSMAKQTGYAFAPTQMTKSSGWLWTWSLGIPQGTSNRDAAWKFVSWATSKQYDQLVAQKYGWSITLASIDGTYPTNPTVNPVPYVGIQYVDIPQFETLGLQVAQQIAGAIAGSESVSQALKTAQQDASQYTPAELSGS